MFGYLLVVICIILASLGISGSAKTELGGKSIVIID